MRSSANSSANNSSNTHRHAHEMHKSPHNWAAITSIAPHIFVSIGVHALFRFITDLASDRKKRVTICIRFEYKIVLAIYEYLLGRSGSICLRPTLVVVLERHLAVARSARMRAHDITHNRGCGAFKVLAKKTRKTRRAADLFT